ncbi:ribose-phosphate pyrophosphokinase [Lachnospiraceae bacterium 56-18]|jgi:ribose-phosphate pyrophosphokinase|uniref:ribose-phosphate pyrophosphokinase n=1 Tax=Sporofaciens sp. JLR.KK001 TaxID=3112621 RepID=UPI002FF2F5E0
MQNIKLMEKLLPAAPLKIAALESCKEFGKRVDDYIVGFRQATLEESLDSPLYQSYRQDSYLVSCHCPRFGTGEAKGLIDESIRGKDLYLMVDVCNYSLSYTVNGHPNHMSPDDHYQDLKRIISAANGKAHRLNVIMPFLYESRQHKRTKRESLDCALALQELADMGVDNIITFDAHDPRVQNSIPLHGFDSFNPPYQFIKALLRAEPNLIVDKEHLMIISPDEGAMHRAIYFSNVTGVNMGMFYKRRDYSTVINGKNPIVEHEFLGDDIHGKDVIIVDDMISSGESMLDVAKQIKERGANRVFVCTTFGLFTEGFGIFDDYYSKGYIDRVITTNLTYLPPAAYEKPYFVVADMCKFMALIIDSMNHDVSIGKVLNPTDKIHALLKAHTAD